MAGKMCNGSGDISAVKARNSTAFCEGMLARTLATVPSNPHVVGSEASDAWLAGVAVAAANVGGAIAIADQGCCGIGAQVVAGP